MKPVVELWEFVGLGLIVEYPSGIIYSNQIGGTHKAHPQVEGVFVPVANTVPNDRQELLSPAWELSEYFWGPKHDGRGAPDGLDDADADFLDALFLRRQLSHLFSVDRRRLRDSHEAWVHVTVQGSRLFSGLEPLPRQGVITWMNSD